MNWLRKLFSRCQHEWELYRELKLRDERGRLIGDRLVLRCWKCGDFTSRDV